MSAERNKENARIYIVIKIFQINRVSKCILVIFRNVCTLISSHPTSKMYPKEILRKFIQTCSKDLCKKTVIRAKWNVEKS